MKTRLKLFLEWGIEFENPYEIAEQAARKVAYADRFELEQEIIQRGCAYEDYFDEVPEPPIDAVVGGVIHSPVPEYHGVVGHKLPIRTD